FDAVELGKTRQRLFEPQRIAEIARERKRLLEMAASRGPILERERYGAQQGQRGNDPILVADLACDRETLVLIPLCIGVAPHEIAEVRRCVEGATSEQIALLRAGTAQR